MMAMIFKINLSPILFIFTLQNYGYKKTVEAITPTVLNM